MSPLVSACPASLLLIGQGSPAPALRLAYLKVGCPAPLPLPLSPLPPREPPTGGLGHNLCWKLLAEYQPALGPQHQLGADCCFIMGSFSLRSVFPRAIAWRVPHPCPGLSPMPSGAPLPHPWRFWDMSGRSFLLGKFPTISHLGKMSGPLRRVGTGLGSAPSHIGAIQGPAAPQAHLARSNGPAPSTGPMDWTPERHEGGHCPK